MQEHSLQDSGGAGFEDGEEDAGDRGGAVETCEQVGVLVGRIEGQVKILLAPRRLPGILPAQGWRVLEVFPERKECLLVVAFPGTWVYILPGVVLLWGVIPYPRRPRAVFPLPRPLHLAVSGYHIPAAYWLEEHRPIPNLV